MSPTFFVKMFLYMKAYCTANMLQNAFELNTFLADKISCPIYSAKAEKGYHNLFQKILNTCLNLEPTFLRCG